MSAFDVFMPKLYNPFPVTMLVTSISSHVPVVMLPTVVIAFGSKRAGALFQLSVDSPHPVVVVYHVPPVGPPSVTHRRRVAELGVPDKPCTEKETYGRNSSLTDFSFPFIVMSLP